MSILSSLIIISLSILCVCSFNYQRSENDKMCKIKGGILCVKDELMIIATIAQGIARKSIEIEKDIQKIKTSEILNRHVNFEMNYTRNHSPISDYHNEFFRRNNIDKEFLSQLLFEAHDAMIYYYHSINALLNLKVVFAEKIDDSFKKIRDNIRLEVICRYRTVLDVYSQKWKSVHDIGGIQFSKNPRLCPSCKHEVYSVVIARYLREWMEQITEVIKNLGTKF